MALGGLEETRGYWCDRTHNSWELLRGKAVEPGTSAAGRGREATQQVQPGLPLGICPTATLLSGHEAWSPIPHSTLSTRNASSENGPTRPSLGSHDRRDGVTLAEHLQQERDMLISCVRVFCLHVCQSTTCLPGSCGVQKRAMHLLELELLTCVSHHERWN